MICDKCGKEMKEETLFTSVNYSCTCSDGWLTVDALLDMITPMNLPIKLKYEDSDGQGSVIVNDIGYFNRCPKNRKFKIIRLYDSYIGYQVEDDVC